MSKTRSKGPRALPLCKNTDGSLIDARDELVLDDLAITIPIFAVLNGAPKTRVSHQSFGSDSWRKRVSRTVQSHEWYGGRVL